MERLLIAILPILLVSCATIFSGTTQALKITSEPSGADVLIEPGPTTGTTPNEFLLRRKDAPYRVTISLDGYDDISFKISAAGNGWVWGNLVLGGLIGMLVDGSTGAAVRLEPSELHANLIPLQTSRRSSIVLLAIDGRPLGRIDLDANAD